MAVVIAKQERHSMSVTSRSSLSSTPPSKRRKLILDLDDEENEDEDEKNVNLVPTQSGNSPDGHSVPFVNLFLQTKKRSLRKRPMAAPSVELLNYDSSDEDCKGHYISMEKLMAKVGSSEARTSREVRKGPGKRQSGTVCKRSNEKKIAENKAAVIRRGRESESDEEWDERKEKQRQPGDGSTTHNSQRNQIKDMENKRTLKRSRSSSNKFLEMGFVCCDWVDDEEDLVSYIDTNLGGSGYVSVPTGTQSSHSNDTGKSNTSSLKGARRKYSDDGSAKLSSSDLSSSSTSTSISTSSTPKIDRKAVQRSATKNKKVSEIECNKCHQCRKSNRKFIVSCSECKERAYCIQCLEHWYPTLSEEEVLEVCPYCRQICNCNFCLHSSSILKTSKRDINDDEKIRHLHYLITNVFPHLEKIHRDQVEGIQKESKIQNVPASSVEVKRAVFYNDERVYWSMR